MALQSRQEQDLEQIFREWPAMPEDLHLPEHPHLHAELGTAPADAWDLQVPDSGLQHCSGHVMMSPAALAACSRGVQAPSARARERLLVQLAKHTHFISFFISKFTSVFPAWPD